MAKESGLAWTTASRDDSAGAVKTLVNDVLNLDYSTPRNVQESTGLDQSSMERILLLGDYQSSWSGIFNDTSGQAHDVHKTVASSSVTRTETLVISGQTLANEVLLTDYQLARAASGEFTWVGPAMLQSGSDPTWT